MNKKYSYLLFDLDNTLVDDNKNRKYAISKVLDKLNYKYDDKALNSYVLKDNEYWKKMGKREFDYMRPKGMNKEETFIWANDNRMKYFFKELSIDKCNELSNLYLNSIREKVFPIDGVKDLLHELNDMGYILYIITNGPTKAAINKRFSLTESNFKDMITSEEIGFMKPHHEFYEAMYRKFNIYNKDKMLIIGDELDKDILGGINEGIDTVWLNNNNSNNSIDVNPTYEITNIKKLKKILIK